MPPLQSLLEEQKVPPQTPAEPGRIGGHLVCAATSMSAQARNTTTQNFGISGRKL
jgi:hypothetical protein